MGRVQKEAGASAVTEIREYGDKETVVLYTEDDLIYTTLREKAQKEVPYEVWKGANPGSKRLIGIDLYFPRTSKGSVKRVFSQLQKHGKNALTSKSCQESLKAI